MTGPAPAIRLLHLEDSEPDHALAMAYLQRGGIHAEPLRIESRAEFAAALQQPWDIVVSDYHLPGFGGLEALQMLRASGRPLPFIRGRRSARRSSTPT